MKMSRLISESAIVRWIATTPAAVSVPTVTPPTITCTPSSTVDGDRGVPHRLVGAVVRARCRKQARVIRNPVIDATRRCENSIQTFLSAGGMISPWQSGQSGQAVPGVGGAHGPAEDDQAVGDERDGQRVVAEAERFAEPG